MHMKDNIAIDMIVDDLQNVLPGEHRPPVIAISSVNRSSYLSPITLQSLKESGGLDYGADVVWALQPDIVFNFSDKDSTETRERKLREDEEIALSNGNRLIRLKCLKNRMGEKTDSCLFNYYPKLEFFEETYRKKSTAAQAKSESKRADGVRIRI